VACDTYRHGCRFMANKLEEFKGLDELLSFLTRFLASPDYVKNPYLRAKIVRHTHTSHITHKAIGGGIHAALTPGRGGAGVDAQASRKESGHL